MNSGVAITSSVWLDERTHLEPVRYGHGSNLMGLLGTVLTDGGGRAPRWVRWLGQVVRHPRRALSVLTGLRSFSDRAVIGLVNRREDPLGAGHEVTHGVSPPPEPSPQAPLPSPSPPSLTGRGEKDRNPFQQRGMGGMGEGAGV